MDRYERVEQIDYKGARDVVTEVDRLSEELIIAGIHTRHPGDAILGEESGDVAQAGTAGADEAVEATEEPDPEDP